MAAKKDAGLLFIFITLLIDVTGFGIIIPVLPKLLMELVQGDLNEASWWGGALQVTYAAMQFIFAPIIGGLSDQYGRRPVLLASLFAFGLDFILLGFAPNIGWLFFGRMIAGITGASFSTATAYIADISEPEKRAQNFGLIGAAFGLGFVLGPILGGFLGVYSSRLPFFVAAGLSLVNWLYGFFILPESLKPENRRPFDIKRANPIAGIIRLKKYPTIIGLVVSLFLIYIAGHANQSSWTYITMEKFNWDEKMIGFSLAWVGLMVGLVQGGLSRIIIPKIGAKRAIISGLIFYTIGFTLFAFANQSWMMFAFMCIFALGGLCGPSLQSLIANEIPANEQGELQGTLASLVSLTSILGPWLMNIVIFHYFSQKETSHYFPGAPFLAGAILILISGIVAMPVLKKSFSTIILLAIVGLSACAPQAKKQQSVVNTQNQLVNVVIDTNWTEKVIKSNDEWKKILTPEQYYIAREHGTERAFSSEHYNNHENGIFICIACENPLFSSQTKFDSGTGWPSYYAPFSSKSLGYIRDESYGMIRTEVHCLRCEAHLGHVFDDGPKPTGLRFCIDGIGLKFIKF